MSSISSIRDKFFDFIPQLPEDPTTFCGKHFTTRLYHLLVIPAEIITRLVDGILAMGGYLAHLVTGGKKTEVFEFLVKHTFSFGGILAEGTKRIILFINPQAKMSEPNPFRKDEENLKLGALSKLFFDAVGDDIEKPSKSFTDVLKKASLALPMLIISVVDVIFGVVVSVFALMTLGTWTKCNDFAYDHLNLRLNGLAIVLSLAPNIPRKKPRVSQQPKPSSIKIE